MMVAVSTGTGVVVAHGRRWMGLGDGGVHECQWDVAGGGGSVHGRD
jgi:hypothetical protein